MTPLRSALAEPFLPFPVLEGLLSPFGLQPFLEDYWEKRWLLVEANAPSRDALRVPGWEALTLPAFERDRRMVEVLSAPRGPEITEFEQVREAFEKGTSIRILNAQRVFEPLNAVCAALSLELSHPVRANVYITPPNRQGLDPHVDDHDVLVVQMSGRKGWKIYGAPFELPLEHSFPLFFEVGAKHRARSTWLGEIWGARSFKGQDLGEPSYDGPIETGEFLYVPRGVLHVASSLEEASVHATIGIHATRIADLAVLALDRVARENHDLRRSVPLGFARYLKDAPELKALIDEALHMVTAEGVRDTLDEIGARHLVSHRETFEPEPAPEAPPAPDMDTDVAHVAAGHSTEPPVKVPVRPFEETRLRLFPDVQISHRADLVSVRRFKKGSGRAEFPAAFENALIEIASKGAFGIADLKALSARSTRTLLTHLVEKGLVEQLP